MKPTFAKIGTEAARRRVHGEPSPLVRNKALPELDEPSRVDAAENLC